MAEYQLTPHQLENFVLRKELLAKLEKKKSDGKFLSALFEKCKQDPIFWINMFGWTFDPRLPPGQKEIPFLLYKFQEDAIWQLMASYKNQEDLFVEKSRDMGLTWLLLHYPLAHCWLFEENFAALIGSRKENLVDGSRAGEDLDPLMLRLDFIIRSQPKLFIQDYEPSQHRVYMGINHPNRKSMIKGESANADFGRQGRYSLSYIDEFGSWQFAQQAWQACSQSSPCRIVTTTPSKFGMMHHSSRLRKSGKIRVYTIHWRKHPFKDDAWYIEQKERMTDDEVARELDIAYQTSVSGAVYPEWRNVEKDKRYEYDPSLPLYVSWDFGLNDDTAMIWWQKDFKKDIVYLIDSYSNSKKYIDYYLPFVNGTMISEEGYFYGAEELKKIEEHKDWKAATHFGDASARQQHQASKSTVERQLQDHGIYLNINDNSSWQERRDRAKLLMKRLRVDCLNNQYLIDCMYNARYPEVSETSQSTSEASKPVHDVTSHFRTAFEFFAIDEPEFDGGIKMVREKPSYINPYTKY